MFELLVGLILFLSAAAVVALLQIIFKISYEQKPFLFLTIFILLIIGAVYVMEFGFIHEILIGAILLAALYAGSIIGLVRYWKPMKNLYGADTVPTRYLGIVSPKPAGQFPKVIEVVLQDLSAWLIVGGLLTLTNSLSFTIIIFAAIVFILHIPGVWEFGKVYGNYFLILSTALSCIVPLFYLIGPLWFLAVYAIHLSGYIVMYLLMGFLGRKELKLRT